MITFKSIWRKLSNKQYRDHYSLSLLKRSVAFQIKTLRKKHCVTQAVLAEKSNLKQGVISRAEDQDYGNLTFNTVGRIAAGLDVAFIGKFVPFSDLIKFTEELSEAEFKSIPTFGEENAALLASGALGLGDIENQEPLRETPHPILLGPVPFERTDQRADPGIAADYAMPPQRIPPAGEFDSLRLAKVG